MASGIFSACGNIRPMTLEKLNRHVKFAFPDRYFNGIDTAGRIRAVSIYYLSGKSPTHIVFAKAVVLGKEVRLAIACSTEKTRKVIIKEREGRQNLVTILSAIEIESVSPIQQLFRSAFPKPNPIVPPDFSFQSAFPAEKRRGTISRADKAYLKYLADEIRLTWKLNKFNLPTVSTDEIIETAAESLVRSSDAKLERLVAWQMLLPEDADNIFTRSRQIDAERIALMLMGLTAEHISLGDFSPQQIRLAAKNLIPHHFMNYLVNIFEKDNLSLADAWYFAKEYSDPETALRTAFAKKKRLVETYKKEDLSPADVWYFVKGYADPEQALNTALTEAKRLARTYEQKGVSFSDAFYFAAHTPSGPEKALQSALVEAQRLARKYNKKGVSYADAWYFTTHHPFKSEKALITALAEAKRLARAYKKDGISSADAWYFAVHHPSDTKGTLITVLTEAERLADKFSISVAVARRLIRAHSDPETVIKNSCEQTPNII